MKARTFITLLGVVAVALGAAGCGDGDSPKSNDAANTEMTSSDDAAMKDDSAASDDAMKDESASGDAMHDNG